MRKVLILTMIGFCLLCGLLVAESGLVGGLIRRCGPCILLQKTAGEEAAETNDANVAAVETEAPKLEAAVSFGADHAEAKTVILGAPDPNTEDPEMGFKFQLELSSKGAGIRTVTFSDGNGNGFDDRDPDDPQPLVLISPAKTRGGGEILAMANASFVLANYRLGELFLDGLHWKSAGAENGEGGSQIARFEAIIKVEDTNEPAMKLTKTFKVRPGSYLMDCDIAVENLSEKEEKVYFNLHGPMGMDREGIRSDTRNVVGGFLSADGSVVSSKRDMSPSFFGRFKGKVGLRDSSDEYEQALQSRDKKQIDDAAKKTRIGYNIDGAPRFLWAAASNKYFTGILRPVPDEGKDYCQWVSRATCWYRNPDKDRQNYSGDESIGIKLETMSEELTPGGTKEYRFQLYLGPKDRGLFHKNAMYKKLRFVETISFMGCCCPASIIKPLAFGILWIMTAMYGVIGNYGVVIIILVFCVRLIMHPITKKSQVSMSKMQKLGPMAEEIKKKYASNKAEMNKHMMALYKEHGASPIMGFLPMMIQMPIWISLWSAIYASIDLRGAAFLPFWITDLSLPDALWTFPKVLVVPLIGWKIVSLNLLPLMMGVAFYMQQKLMPKQAAAATNPQVAQQQKMMMIMMPLLFPLMLYNAPSGVNLYIMSSTFAGVIEQFVIRKHVREKDEAESQGLVATTKKTGGKVKKKKPKPFYKT